MSSGGEFRVFGTKTTASKSLIFQTKNVPLEEIAKLFGDEVAVLSKDFGTVINQRGEVVLNRTRRNV